MDALLWALLIAAVIALVLWFRNRRPAEPAGRSPEVPAGPATPLLSSGGASPAPENTTEADPGPLKHPHPDDPSAWESKDSEAVVRPAGTARPASAESGVPEPGTAGTPIRPGGAQRP